MDEIKQNKNKPKQETMDIILLDYGQHKEIMELLNVSYPTIRRALKGETLNRRAQLIREIALKMGGRLLKSYF